MHRRSQVSRTSTVTRRATARGVEAEAPLGALWLTEAGGRDDIRATSTFPTRAVKRRIMDGPSGPRGQSSGARTGLPAAGR